MTLWWWSVLASNLLLWVCLALSERRQRRRFRAHIHKWHQWTEQHGEDHPGF